MIRCHVLRNDDDAATVTLTNRGREEKSRTEREETSNDQQHRANTGARIAPQRTPPAHITARAHGSTRARTLSLLPSLALQNSLKERLGAEGAALARTAAAQAAAPGRARDVRAQEAAADATARGRGRCRVQSGAAGADGAGLHANAAAAAFVAAAADPARCTAPGMFAAAMRGCSPAACVRRASRNISGMGE